MGAWFDDFRTWAATPFSADMNATHWFMFVGLLLLILMLWGMILGHIKAAAQ